MELFADIYFGQKSAFFSQILKKGSFLTPVLNIFHHPKGLLQHWGVALTTIKKIVKITCIKEAAFNYEPFSPFN